MDDKGSPVTEDRCLIDSEIAEFAFIQFMKSTEALEEEIKDGYMGVERSVDKVDHTLETLSDSK